MGKKRAKQKAAPAAKAPELPQGATLVAAAALALVNLGWAAFQWQQLVVARSGGTPICGPGSGDCTVVWDSAFASWVHQSSGLPLAGWGVVWSVTALAFPLWLLSRSGSARALAGAWSATCLTAVAGVASVVVLVGTSLLVGQLCATCTLTHLLVVAYAAVCASQVPRFRPLQLRQGALLASAVTVIAFALALFAGLRTPGAQLSTYHAALSGPEVEPRLALSRLMDTLSARELEMLRNSWRSYVMAQSVPVRTPRALIGPGNADVRLTEFTDIRCGHCARLHEELEEIRAAVSPGAFSLEPRQFPLDGACNPGLQESSGDPVRCQAARMLICLEGHPDFFDFTGKLFAEQRTLTVERLYELAEPLMPRSLLASCAESDQTASRLADDEAWASQHGIRGTPMVLVNGRQVPAYPPFLYAIILAGGDAQHEAFQALR